MEITDITRESDDAVQEMVVTMTASADEVNTYIEQQFKELAKNEIPGFRKGKARVRSSSARRVDMTSCLRA